MKTYEEMAASALKNGLELRQRDQKRKKVLLRTGAVMVCLALVAGVVWAGQHRMPEMPMVPETGTEPPVNGPVQITEDLPAPKTDTKDPIPVPQDPTVKTESADAEEEDGEWDGVFPPYAGTHGDENAEGREVAGGSSLEWWCMRLENAYASYGEPDAEACYATPESGEFFCTPMIERALEELGDDALFGAKIYLFREGKPCGKEVYQEQAERLKELEIPATVIPDLVTADAYGTEPVDTLQALWTKEQIEQIRAFAESGEYGWFMFFYEQVV